MLQLLSQQDLINRVPEIAKNTNARVTVIARDGRVLAESEKDPAKMENHSARPEVIAALQGKNGWSERESTSLNESFLYVAVPTSTGVLRLSMPTTYVNQEISTIRREVLVAVTLSFLPAALIAGLFARYFSEKLAAIIAYAGQLAKGNFQARLPNPGKDELGVLSRQLNETGEKLERMFEELQKEHTELEKLERIRKDFVINVSHELRTPLASIQGYTETLLEGAIHEPEHNIRFLTIIRQNAERLARLTSDLLSLSRIELKTQKFQFAAYYVNHLLREDVDTVRPMAEKKKITITLEPAPEEEEVFCDAEAVHQILSNLLDNALKYTPEGGRIFVGAEKVEGEAPGREQVKLYVRDTGIGIPEDDLPRLFERFYRVDKARSRELGGTGLGLAIVKHLVRAQGGEIGVTSEFHKGSTFSFTLPVHDIGQIESSRTIQAELTA